MQVDVRYLTDPACSWSWADERTIRRLMGEFGDELRWTFVMGAWPATTGPRGGSDAAEAELGGRGSHAWLMAHWLEEVRTGPDEARDLDQVKGSADRERLPFPTLVLAGADGERRALYGCRPYEEVAAAARAAGASPVESPPPEVLIAVRSFGRMATNEVAAVCDLPGPRAVAELWEAV